MDNSAMFLLAMVAAFVALPCVIGSAVAVLIDAARFLMEKQA